VKSDPGLKKKAEDLMSKRLEAMKSGRRR